VAVAEVIQKTCRLWIYVFEINEQDGFLSGSGKPKVHVCVKTHEPGRKIARWIRSNRKAKKLHIAKVRYDLMPPRAARGGLERPFISADGNADYKNAVKDLKKKLKREGYVVIRNPRRLYVIELKPSRNTPKHAVGSVYVGQTSFPVEERIKQHRLGPEYPWKEKSKHSPRCHQRFVQPRLDLIPQQFKVIYGSKEEALVAESDLRIHFESLGYEVIGGKERYDKQRKLIETA